MQKLKQDYEFERASLLLAVFHQRCRINIIRCALGSSPALNAAQLNAQKTAFSGASM